MNNEFCWIFEILLDIVWIRYRGKWRFFFFFFCDFETSKRFVYGTLLCACLESR